MYLAFDTETTDLPRNHLEKSHPAQPHLLQFAAIPFDDMGYEIDRLFTLVKPGPSTHLRGRHTTRTVFSWNGRPRRHGLARCLPLVHCQGQQHQAPHRPQRAVRHSDHGDIGCPSYRSSLGTRLLPLFCTMAHSAPIVNLPPTARMLAAGRNPPSRRRCQNASVISSERDCPTHMMPVPTSKRASGCFIILRLNEYCEGNRASLLPPARQARVLAIARGSIPRLSAPF